VTVEGIENNSLPARSSASESSHGEFSDSDVVVICGYGPVGQLVARFLSEEVVSKCLGNDETGGDRDFKPSKSFECVSFDLDPNLVVQGYKQGAYR
jgi:hypothetical protein